MFLYKDTFLSGWGKGTDGSYIVSDIPILRSDFKYMDQFKSIENGLPVYRSANVIYWKQDGTTWNIEFKNRIHSIGKQREIGWNVEKFGRPMSKEQMKVLYR